MNRFKHAYILATVLLTSAAAAAEKPAYLSHYESTPEDVNALLQLTQDFRTALIDKDVRKLSTLMLNSNILFVSPRGPETVKMINEKHDVNFDGVAAGGYIQFSEFIMASNARLEEKFHDVKITQDGPVAWVMFDYEFAQDSKVVNYGHEVWQTLKTPGNRWKILSIVWSSHNATKAG
jgi:hypothetical protein